jgi:LysR family hydrogen peroxide-inducible transcriptional activator
LDAAVVALEADLGEVDTFVVARDPFVLATAPHHPSAQKKTPAQLSELRKSPMLLMDEGHCLRDQTLSFCGQDHVQEPAFRATSLGTLAQMVASGAGLAILPALAATIEVPRAGLRARPFAPPGPGRTIALVWRKRSALASAMAELGAVMKAAYPLSEK